MDERLASLSEGLLALEGHPAPRPLVAQLFRDAHTVKGSARMLGLTAVVAVAHRSEDLLGALRDGRLSPRRDLVDTLLGACAAITANLPGSDGDASALDHADEALRAALADGEAESAPSLPARTRPEPTRPEQRAPEPEPVDAGSRFAAALHPPGAASSAAPSSSAAPGSGFATRSRPDRDAATTTPTTRTATATATPATLATPATPVGAPALFSAPAQPPPPATIRVPVRRVHGLLDLVGEAELAGRQVDRQTSAVATASCEHLEHSRALRDALRTDGRSLPPQVALALHALLASGDQLAGASRDLDTCVEDLRGRLDLVRGDAMGLAMVPVRRVVAAFPALVRDVARRTGKEVGLVLRGQEVELDSRVLDGVAEALRHLVINAVDHGCEPAQERIERGKPARSTLMVSARAAGSTVVIEVADDGGGIDQQRLRERAVAAGLLDGTASDSSLYRLLFRAGFSTRTEVSETSGRGVGLDVVATAMEELGGSVDVTSVPGAGTRFTLTLPVTLGVLRCVVARVGDERYALPVPGIVETVSLSESPPSELAGTSVIVRHGRSVPLLDLGQVLDAAGPRAPRAAVVVSRGGGELLAWAVDELEGEHELVVKELGGFLGRLPALAGATVDGDGSVLLLVDLRELSAERLTTSSGPVVVARAHPQTPVTSRPRVLVVEDSVGVRELERAILESAGYDVIACVDGLDAAARLAEPPVDLVLTDVEMPGMDGLSLTRTLRRTRGWEQVPVIIMTSREDTADRDAGLEAGADAYLLKGEFNQVELIDTVRRMLGR